jgi:hypothetical protein
MSPIHEAFLSLAYVIIGWRRLWNLSLCQDPVIARCRQYGDVLLPVDPADPDMCGHLWPAVGPGAVEAFGDGLAAVEEGTADDECDRAGIEVVVALTVLSPNARVAPSTAPPAAVPTSGLLILTRFSFRRHSAGRRPEADQVAPRSAG